MDKKDLYFVLYKGEGERVLEIDYVRSFERVAKEWAEVYSPDGTVTAEVVSGMEFVRRYVMFGLRLRGNRLKDMYKSVKVYEYWKE